jgi:hypothetical protein
VQQIDRTSLKIAAVFNDKINLPLLCFKQDFASYPLNVRELYHFIWAHPVQILKRTSGQLGSPQLRGTK